MFTVRPIIKQDDPQVEELIRTVMTEHGASGEGFAIHDPEVKAMSAAYRGGRSQYFVVTDGERVLGGGGFAPLNGLEDTTCEVRKMYFYPELRGKGMGRQLLERILQGATQAGFQTCYLETLGNMEAARHLYEKMAFQKIDKPMGNTGHFGCNHWYAKNLV